MVPSAKCQRKSLSSSCPLWFTCAGDRTPGQAMCSLSLSIQLRGTNQILAGRSWASGLASGGGAWRAARGLHPPPSPGGMHCAASGAPGRHDPQGPRLGVALRVQTAGEGERWACGCGLHAHPVITRSSMQPVASLADTRAHTSCVDSWLTLHWDAFVPPHMGHRQRLAGADCPCLHQRQA